MPKLYLAKVNLNSKIFSVYENELDINDVLKIIYDRLNTDERCGYSVNAKHNDSTGNEISYLRYSYYYFADLNKSDMKITGKMIRKYSKFNDKVNEKTGKVESVLTDESVAIRFYFDIEKEMVTFCERQCFGYNQFIDGFNELLNKCVKDYEFQTYLQKDKNRLEEKIKELYKITKVKAVLIPPNPNGGNVRSIKDNCINTNSTKMTWEFESDDMKMDSEEMKEIREYISAGYGDLTATGVDFNGKTQRISSSQDAAFCIDISENLNDEEFVRESKHFLIKFEEYKNKQRNV